MITLEVHFNLSSQPVIFTDIDEIYDNWKTIEIIQHDLYKTKKTKIIKASVEYYSIIDRV